MKLLIIAILLSSCSLIKSKSDRCFDLYEEYGKVNMYFESGKQQVYCGEYPRGE